jgi:ABC-2 type transport system ATP-binding protein
MGVAIRTEGLGKRYYQQGEIEALVDLNVEVQEGEIFGFLGPNGAGKTTTIKILLGLIFPTTGSAEVLGRPAGDLEMRRRVSYLPESPYFYDHLTGVELLDFYGRLFRLPQRERQRRTHELIDQVGLKNDKAKQLKQYSKGMLQRIGIAQALVNDPTLLILDEPTSGLDPVAHIEIRHLIRSLKDRGKTVFLSSHQLTDVEQVCDRVAILNFGRLVRTGTVSELTAGTRTQIVARLNEAGLTRLRDQAADFTTENGQVVITEPDPDRVGSLIDFIRGCQGDIVSIIPLRRRLEEIFVESVGLTGGRQIGTMNQLTEDESQTIVTQQPESTTTESR